MDSFDVICNIKDVISNRKIYNNPIPILIMTSIDEHKKNFGQFMADINEKIRARLLIERQKIIAFDASEAATNILEYYFHKKKVIPAGFQTNHNYFSSEERAKRYLDFDFPKKKEIVNLMVNQEKLRNLLCYGKEKELAKIEEAIDNLNKIKEIISKELGEEI